MSWNYKIDNFDYFRFYLLFSLQSNVARSFFRTPHGLTWGASLPSLITKTLYYFALWRDQGNILLRTLETTPSQDDNQTGFQRRHESQHPLPRHPGGELQDSVFALFFLDDIQQHNKSKNKNYCFFANLTLFFDPLH